MDQRATRESWSDDNARGLAYAAVGAWSQAAEAFASAAEGTGADSDVSTHEALALILGNLAQASFRSGRAEDAIRHGQRACSLRAALMGDDAIAVARARADLAVMLGSVGRAEEGLQLMTRAIGSIERIAGDEDLRLSTVLENAARLAMAAGQPSTAEPYLIRLHALLAANEQPTDAADVLLARVASYRERDRASFAASTARFDEQSVTSRAITPAVMTSIDDANAAPRWTPDIAPSIPFGVAGLDFELTDDTTVGFADTITGRDTESSVALVDMALAIDAHDDMPVVDDIFGNATFDLVDVEPTSPQHVDTPKDVRPLVQSHDDVLGFVVEYGTTIELGVPDLADMIIEAPVVPAQVPTAVTASATQPTVSAPTGSAALPLAAANHDATRVPLSSHMSDIGALVGRDERPPMPAADNTESQEADRRGRRPNIRAGRASAPRSSRGLMIAGIVTVAIAISVGWLIRSGGF